jgi:hypothetical protein
LPPLKVYRLQKIQKIIFSILISFGCFVGLSFAELNKSVAVTTKVVANSFFELYTTLNLQSLGLSQSAFNYAIVGYNQLLNTGKIKNDDVLSIIDFSLPSSKKRLFVIDLKQAVVLFNTYVSHGKNSGKDNATIFSNKDNSFKSSLGFYVTANTYNGKHGLSLRLEGEEKGINDNAMNRGIVMHAANYVSENFINAQGYLGRSEGCPAIPAGLHKPIIEKIKDGSCLFIYSVDKYYTSHSRLITQKIG